MSKKTQATLVLVIMFLGFIATYKLDSFWGLLLNHGFLAALIGGLADWFVVTALFRKPLGFISYRTEILPRNRERIMEKCGYGMHKSVAHLQGWTRSLCKRILFIEL